MLRNQRNSHGQQQCAGPCLPATSTFLGAEQLLPNASTATLSSCIARDTSQDVVRGYDMGCTPEPARQAATVPCAPTQPVSGVAAAPAAAVAHSANVSPGPSSLTTSARAARAAQAARDAEVELDAEQEAGEVETARDVVDVMIDLRFLAVSARRQLLGRADKDSCCQAAFALLAEVLMQRCQQEHAGEVWEQHCRQCHPCRTHLAHESGLIALLMDLLRCCRRLTHSRTGPGQGTGPASLICKPPAPQHPARGQWGTRPRSAWARSSQRGLAGWSATPGSGSGGVEDMGQAWVALLRKQLGQDPCVRLLPGAANGKPSLTQPHPALNPAVCPCTLRLRLSPLTLAAALSRSAQHCVAPSTQLLLPPHMLVVQSESRAAVTQSVHSLCYLYKSPAAAEPSPQPVCVHHGLCATQVVRGALLALQPAPAAPGQGAGPTSGSADTPWTSSRGLRSPLRPAGPGSESACTPDARPFAHSPRQQPQSGGGLDVKSESSEPDGKAGVVGSAAGALGSAAGVAGSVAGVVGSAAGVLHTMPASLSLLSSASARDREEEQGWGGQAQLSLGRTQLAVSRSSRWLPAVVAVMQDDSGVEGERDGERPGPGLPA
ncbi:hypothetical protein HaLaN_18117 [Haematococcus lacustris]|uniref:Uncharacterized protein n=1 Tax=Haematococcus lacustris TaxID=44745 RepID=A0A699ZIJ3_HAELA|nr:hypothetical protein HaLaN_18117 [Haematococcus lacustris]